MRWPQRLRPRSLRGRLVLIAGLLATCAVVLCQIAGLALLHSWLTDQVDDRLTDFRPPARVYQDLADGTLPHDASDVLPSDYRVFLYDAKGRLLSNTLGQSKEAGPQLPENAADLNFIDGEPTTVPSDRGSEGSSWRVIADSGPDRMRAVVALPLDTVEGATTKMLWFSIFLGVTVAVGVVLLGNAAIRLGLRPLTRVERTAQQITGGALELTVPVSDPDTEVGRLGLALNTMLDRLRTALHRTENSEQRMRRFMADAGHELRTPLTAIQGFAELLLDQSDTAGDQCHEAHVLIAHNASRMSRLVDDLFLLAKLGYTPEPQREAVDLLSLAADAISTAAVRHSQRAIGLEPLGDRPASHGQDLDVVEAWGDPHQLAQVLTNLLSNACIHTPADSRIHVRVGATRTGPHAGGTVLPGRTSLSRPLPAGLPVCVIEVVDNGPGIASDDARYVFDRFYRAEPPSLHAPHGETGSGLGLAIASAIAEAHEGRLELDTRPGNGCTFRLLLPHPAIAPREYSHETRHRPADA
ncbi:HAMP domain-containing sensor histidine kinase [Streptomyces sp. ZAF1911]|uniref:sensor histidine kinase n=1 Tax=Streptomyces sp. ZAF1911 TaxID=2944129 RepID=UPI00237BC655|nr:HAMP domain-containing sensor histidine kinase [Streptomyces sp. ZAF1911]MDD9376914.1 HAMP domain-containing sensor histidine kinase [Streptomyces sp. ZAF1911]